MLDKDDEFITTSEACEILQVSKTIIKRMADSGELETWKTPGGHRRIKRSSIEQKHQEQGVAKPQSESAPLKVMVIDDDAVIQKIFTSLINDSSLLLPGFTHSFKIFIFSVSNIASLCIIVYIESQITVIGHNSPYNI